MVDVQDEKDLFLIQFEQLEEGERNGAAWLMPVRKAAMARFAELGFPTTKDEEWRYTNVARIAETVFDSPTADEGAVREADLAPFLVDPKGPRLVLVNGRFAPGLSNVQGLPAGARLLSLAEAIRAEDETVRAHLTRHAGFEDQAFAALNTALMEDGALFHVKQNQIVERPVQVLYLHTGGTKPTAVHPRTLVVAGENSQLTLVETFAGLGEGVYFHNVVTEIVAEDGAVVDHYKITREAAEGMHMAVVHHHLHAKSTIRSMAASLGGALTRHDIVALLDGEGSECVLNGLYMVRDGEHVDNHLVVEHAKAHCDSKEYFKGILDGSGKGVFSGRIMVRPGAQKTDAKQTNMSLLLSESAQVESKPQLEIFADDVKCTHGATIGQINEDAIFYLRARGIPGEVARGMLIHAFAGEVLDRIRIPVLRAQLDALVLERLPQGAVL